ncbi:Las1-like-domain-containing protein [Lobosporangium transversale]|uniref:Las1-like-domain-containing protein n=1 Tax=Lobosporangium transversale TaxID=64571 RepID=A0A1Y2GQN4_9FUNG|nr:Las1-like-domain-containing protein [Lobosporangium transversale]ORZ19208.1 Las1-like-domain-containing protein [Lobosporangium transversale]|eukprot:XP_021882376.1 Las1-like-domain-containing protein [Lobosporangium transversale]
MPPKLPKLVPWHSPTEFIQVHQWFYPPSTEDGTPDIQAQERALRRVRAWEARGKLPHAIDSTASFVGVEVRDWTQTCSDQDLRLLYSMVFIRFVNGYVDAFQSSKAAKSIAYLAVEKVGMPIHFVELRHTATHDYLPSLATLRNATQQALQWINDNYWIPQLVSIRMDEVLPPEMTTAMTEDVRLMIESYKNEKERQIEENTLPQPKSEALILNRLVRDLIKRCRSGDDLLDCLIPILLEPGMLVPKSKKGRSTARDLTLDNLGRMVDFCWMPLMNKLCLDLREICSIKDGEPLSFWVTLMDAMLEKLIQANLAVQAAALPTATAQQKTDAKTGSYLITLLAWMKHLIKLHYTQLGSTRGKSTASSFISSISSISSTSSTHASTSTPTPRLSVAAMAAQLVSGNNTVNQPPMFENDDIINIVEDSLQSILVHVSPLIRSLLNTVIECDPEVKEKIGPILRQIDQRIVSAGSSPSTVSSLSVASTATTFPIQTTTTTSSSLSSSPQTTTLLDPMLMKGKLEEEAQFSTPQGEDVDMTLLENAAVSSEMDTQQVSTEECNSHTDQQLMQESDKQVANEPWTLFDAETWRPCPIGCLAGGIVPDLSLPWDLDSPPIARIRI